MNWREDLEYWPRALVSFDVEPRSTALMIIDIQNYLSCPNYGMGKLISDKYPKIANYYFPKINTEVIPNNQKLLTFFRNNKFRVIYFTTGPELVDGSDHYLPRCEKDKERQRTTGYITTFPKGTKEHEINELIKPVEGEIIINKISAGAFNSTPIDFLLRRLKIESLIVTGLVTNGCVEETARGAADIWYKTILVEDACATFEHMAHIATLRNFARGSGMVKTADEVIQDLSNKI